MTTKIINIRQAPKGWQNNPEYVYIGRPGKGLVSQWGNPAKLGVDGDRAEILKKYLDAIKQFDYDYREVPNSKTIREKIQDLRDKTLVCFCTPKLCHGDVLALLADVL